LRPSNQQADAYIERKLHRLPRWLGSPISRVHRDSPVWLRMTIRVLLILGGLLWFLPVLGIWMLPLGLLLLAGSFPAWKRWAVGAAMRIEQWAGRSGAPPA